VDECVVTHTCIGTIIIDAAGGIALFATIVSTVQICPAVTFNKKTAVPVAANGAADTETDDEE
jgi:hypothetical protein